MATRQDEHDTWTDEGEYAIISNTELGLTFNSVPLNLEDLLDVGGEICIPADSDDQDAWTDGREYAVIADNELSLTVHLFPTNRQHTLDMGGEMCIPANLLTRKHDLTVEDLSTGYNWQSGLLWMKLGIEDMQISPY